ncbi:MAG: glycosyl transferase, partial [Pseudomonadota bacterium]|nr:glycosyl transferase [Pseudomonadota bacterium]
MADKNKRTPPLVADRRYANAKPARPQTAHAKPKPNAGPKPGTAKPAPRKKTAPRKARRSGGGGIGGFFRAVWGFILRLIWRVTSRVALVVAL